MGLDVTACKNVKLIIEPKISEADELIQVYHGHFGEQCGELQDGSYYNCEEEDWFCGMSYGSYSHFRNELAKIGGWPEYKVSKPSYDDVDYEDKRFCYDFPNVASILNHDSDEVHGAFVEVINFSDCEGFICSEFCKKLHKDFLDHQGVANEILADNSSYLKMYNGLRDAFEFGSHAGFVQYA